MAAYTNRLVLWYFARSHRGKFERRGALLHIWSALGYLMPRLVRSPSLLCLNIYVQTNILGQTSASAPLAIFYTK
ncbi:hypothetical protein [Microcoleus sp. FACHB-831]|uniref:hypothetical protein n=1 Tax=Microcoleus sp. FACHB-831 TaxID=2692827 RepID=UPI001689213B|nr:hypothetical protein [Microcoleus sp. FACHB-831]